MTFYCSMFFFYFTSIFIEMPKDYKRNNERFQAIAMVLNKPKKARVNNVNGSTNSNASRHLPKMRNSSFSCKPAGKKWVHERQRCRQLVPSLYDISSVPLPSSSSSFVRRVQSFQLFS